MMAVIPYWCRESIAKVTVTDMMIVVLAVVMLMVDMLDW